MMNKKAQIGDLMSNYVMTIVIIVILIVFGLSNALIKISSSNDNKLATLEFPIETYEELFSKYLNYTFRNKDKEIDCDINELMINRIDTREYNGNVIDFKEEDNNIWIKNVVFDWEKIDCMRISENVNPRKYYLSYNISYACCPNTEDSDCDFDFCTNSKYFEMFKEMCKNIFEIKSGDSSIKRSPLGDFVNKYYELFSNEKYNC